MSGRDQYSTTRDVTPDDLTSEDVAELSAALGTRGSPQQCTDIGRYLPQQGTDLVRYLCRVALGDPVVAEPGFGVDGLPVIRCPTKAEQAEARSFVAAELRAYRASARLSPVMVNPSWPVGEAAYLALLRRILDTGAERTDRTGTGTISIFGAQMRFDLRDGFPLLTTKKVPFGPVVRELLWFISGSTNIREGLDAEIWDEWADERGDLGPIYGHQWRKWGAPHEPALSSADVLNDATLGRANWRLSDEELAKVEVDLVDQSSLQSRTSGALTRARAAIRELRERRDATRGLRGVDQLTDAIETIKNNPDSRRIVVSAWNVADVPRMRLPPCHLLFQFYVQDGHLDCQLYQRSADMALGVPFNIASYALLTQMVARECGLTPRYFVHTIGDAHVYLDHVDKVREQLTRAPMQLPRVILSDKPVLEQAFEDVVLDGYVSHPAIKFRVSV